MIKTLNKLNEKKPNKNNKFGIASILIDKNTPSFKFQSLRKEDLYKKGRKGIFSNYIFFMGACLSENSLKMRLRTTLNYFNLKLDIVINKASRNLLISKSIKLKSNIWQ